MLMDRSYETLDISKHYQQPLFNSQLTWFDYQKILPLYIAVPDTR